MPTPIIIPVQQVREVDCIVESGVKYCEKEDANLKDVGIFLLGIIVWMAIVTFCIFQATDSYDDSDKIWALVAGLVFLSPIFAMIAFG